MSVDEVKFMNDCGRLMEVPDSTGVRPPLRKRGAEKSWSRRPKPV